MSNTLINQPSEERILKTFAKYHRNGLARDSLMRARTFRRALWVLDNTRDLSQAKTAMRMLMRAAALDARIYASKGGAL